MRRFLCLFACTLAAAGCSAFAKRGPAADVPPIEHNGIIYSADQSPERMGVVEARDAASGKTLWEKRVYRVFVPPLVEADTRWVFFRSMTLDGDTLVLSNERGEWFALDLKTRGVRRMNPPATGEVRTTPA